MIKVTSAALLLFGYYLNAVSAQHDHNMQMEDPPLPAFNSTGEEPMSYALFPENKGYFYTHVAFMVLAFWILMPMGIMFGIAKSSLHVPTQIIAFLVSLLGYFFGHLYAHSTPHLYKGNSHHKLGWIIFLFLIAQLAVGVVRKIANAVGKSVRYETLHNQDDDDDHEETIQLVRHSSSSSSSSSIHHGDNHSEGSIETLHHNGGYDQHPKKEGDDHHQQQHNQIGDDDEEGELLLDDEDPIQYQEEKPSLWMRGILAIIPYIPKIVKKGFVYTAYNPFTKTICRYYHSTMGRIFVILIFTQTLSGLVVYHGVCREWEVLGCIAHLIKGGIFFFYGMLTFGRYLGAFAEKGWAWNRVDGGAKFSFEFIECGLIFTYGITNTWMEHFGSDSSWTHKDFEHASLAFMWWWCGLIGLLIESRSLRRLLERSILNNPPLLINQRHESHQSYSFNPFPALTVMITGISMGNHHQETQYGTKVHFLWGLLLALAAVSRICTYILLFRSTPTSIQPSRPPTELLGAFCLIAGSILFMASNSGTMTWMRRLNIDTMFMLNVCVALTSITLCYVAGLMILKAWSMKREQRKKEARRINDNDSNNNSTSDRFIGQDA